MKNYCTPQMKVINELTLTSLSVKMSNHVSLASRKAVPLKIVVACPHKHMSERQMTILIMELQIIWGREGALAPKEISHKYGWFHDIKLL